MCLLQTRLVSSQEESKIYSDAHILGKPSNHQVTLHIRRYAAKRTAAYKRVRFYV